ncbi:MAG: hydrogenase maturation peptidase HycI [Candidatus Jordarchaeaceae archaeon]
MMYDKLEDTLKKFLNKPTRIVLLGVGSEFHGDDYVGMKICKKLKKEVSKKVSIIEAGVAPENFAGKLRKINPSHIIIFDAADMNLKPGTVKVINSSEIGGLSLSTHHLPLNLFIDYIKRTTNSSILLIGIQPKSTEASDSLTPELEETVQNISRILVKVLREIL